MLPTRVIDVSGQGDTVRLIETRLISHEQPLRGEYCALSHAWGPPESKTRPVTTTKKNLAQHRQGIRISHLSKTFQEAIEITRAVNVDYLWIDSLCILQDEDDLADWSREAKNMKSVYKSSYLTIAATGATDGSQGCLFSSQRQGPVSIPMWKEERESSPLFLRKTPPHNHPLTQALGPLQDRAWITQEWILSPRLLHCCRTEFIWQCSESELSESGHSYWLDARILEPGEGRRRLVSQYTYRSLTKTTDRLMAMQGIFDEMSEQFKIRFAFGISMHDPHNDLMWYTRDNQHRPQELANLGIPSWSWGSLAGGIQYAWSGQAFPGVDFSNQQSNLFAHCRHPFPLEKTLSLLVADSGMHSIFLDEGYSKDPIFLLPTVMRGLPLHEVDAYGCLLLTLVKRATSNTPAVFKRAGVLLNWRGGVLVTLGDDQKEGYSTVIIR